MINPNLRFLFGWLLITLISGCKESDDFDPYSYNGAYPRNVDGSQIKTYEPQMLGGDVELSFNGHPWNHAPYIRIFSEKFKSGQSGGIDELEVNVQAMVNNNLTDPCGMESLYLRIPLKKGEIDVAGLLNGQQQSDYLRFSSVNCDATKDRYRLELLQKNVLRILEYDSNTRMIEVSIDLHFHMLDRNSDFGPIYPESVHINGAVKTTIRP